MDKSEQYIALGTLITIIAAALALVIRQIEASKCYRVRCGSCCEIHRDVKAPTVNVTNP